MRKILSLALAVLMLFVLVACNGDLQNKIDELQTKLQEQTEKISQLEQAIEELEQTLDQENGDTELSYEKAGNVSYNVALCDMEFSHFYLPDLPEETIEDLPQEYQDYLNLLFPNGIPSRDEYYFFRLIDTLAEWEEAVANHPTLDMAYDQEFFKQKALIVCVQPIGNRGSILQSIEVFVDNGTATIRLNVHEGITDAMSNWALVVEVNKSDFAEVSQIVIETNFGYNDRTEI